MKRRRRSPLNPWKRQRNSRSLRNQYQQSLSRTPNLSQLVQAFQRMQHQTHQLVRALRGLPVSNDVGDFHGADREVVPGVLRGYRGWTFSSLTLGLAACNYPDHIWVPGRNEAACKATNGTCPCDECQQIIKEREHSVPAGNCTCGFYAKHQPGGWDSRANVLGVIKAYGNVVLGTLGFRAQYAEIEALVPTFYMYDNIGPLLADRYQVPILRDLREMERMFPSIPVDELLPKKEPSPYDIVDWSGVVVTPSPSGGVVITGSPSGISVSYAEWNKMIQDWIQNGKMP